MAFNHNLSHSVNAPITTELLQGLIGNDKALWNQRVQFTYNAFDQARTSGLKIAAGITPIGPSENPEMKKDIHFGTFFTVNSFPVVCATFSSARRGASFVCVRGLGEAGFQPKYNGFMVVINREMTRRGVHYPELNHVHWIAVGY